MNSFERSVLDDYFLEHGYQSQGYFQARVGLQITGKYANIYANADVNTYANTYADAHANAYVNAYTDAHADAHTYAYTIADADAHADADAYTY